MTLTNTVDQGDQKRSDRCFGCARESQAVTSSRGTGIGNVCGCWCVNSVARQMEASELHTKVIATKWLFTR